MIDSAEPQPVEKKKNVAGHVSKIGWKAQLGVLCAMLLLALVGMGITQASEQGAWEYWLLVVVIYAALGSWRNAGRTKKDWEDRRAIIGRELAHWSILLAFLGVVLMFERQEIINRESASAFAVLLVAMSCCLTGIHSDWLLLLVGVVLTVMVVAMAMLEQYSVTLWVVMILVAIAAATFFYFKSKESRATVDPSDAAA